MPPRILEDSEVEIVAPSTSGKGRSYSDDEVELSTGNLDAVVKELAGTGKHLYGGGVEGILGTIGMMADYAGPAQIAETVRRKIVGQDTGGEQLAGLSQYITPERDPNHRYARSVGNFIGGNAVLPMGGIWKNIATGVTGGLGAQAGEDLLGPVGGFIGGLIGGGGPSILDDLWGMGRSALRGATPKEVTGTAAKSLRDFTGLTDKEIALAKAGRPMDVLGDLMTTAEITDNAGMAQIEKQLAASGQRAGQYLTHSNARNDARDALIGGMTRAPAMTDEARGAMLTARADDVAERMSEANRARWSAFDREVPFDLRNAQDEIAGLFPDPAAGRSLNSEVDNLATQIMEATDGTLTSGQTQTIRSQALELLRDKDLHNADRRMLTAIAGAVDDTARNQLPDAQYNLWRSARQGTARQAERFAPRTAGGVLIDPRTRAIDALDRALKGDRTSAIQIRDAMANDPAAMGQIGRGLLERIGRDSQGRITAAKMDRFLEANDGAIREILGPKHGKNLRRVLDDLRSEARVQNNANLASKGQSATQQRQTVAGALQEIISDSTFDTGNPITNRIITRLREGAGLRDRIAVDDLLFKAAMDPDFAEQLARTPSNERIRGFLERLDNAGIKSLRNTGRFGAIGLGRPSSDLLSGDDDQTSGDPAIRGGLLERAPTVEQGKDMPQSQSPQVRSQQDQFGQGKLSSSNPASTAGAKQDIFARLADYIIPSAEAAVPEIEETMPLSDYTPAQLPKILDAIKHVESRGKTSATSSVGAKGQYQLMDATGREWHKKLGIKEPYNPRDPKQSRQIAEAYISYLIERYDGDVTKALTAYHTGMGNVDKGKIGPRGREYAGLVEKAFDRL